MATKPPTSGIVVNNDYLYDYFLGFQLVMGVSLKWMVFVRENPVKMDD